MVKNLPAMQTPGFNPWVGKIPWKREGQSTPVFLPGKCYGQRRLAGYILWVWKESDNGLVTNIFTLFTKSANELCIADAASLLSSFYPSAQGRLPCGSSSSYSLSFSSETAAKHPGISPFLVGRA